MSALYRNKHKKTYKAVKQDDLSRRILAACLSEIGRASCRERV